jgi:hypothetical protein
MTRRWSESSSSGQDTGMEIGTDWRVVSFHVRAPAVLCLIGEFAFGLERLARSPGGSSRQHDSRECRSLHPGQDVRTVARIAVCRPSRWCFQRKLCFVYAQMIRMYTRSQSAIDELGFRVILASGTVPKPSRLQKKANCRRRTRLASVQRRPQPISALPLLSPVATPSVWPLQ